MSKQATYVVGFLGEYDKPVDDADELVRDALRRIQARLKQQDARFKPRERRQWCNCCHALTNHTGADHLVCECCGVNHANADCECVIITRCQTHQHDLVVNAEDKEGATA